MQKTLVSRTNDMTSIQTSAPYGDILILDTAKGLDDGDGKPVVLTATTFRSILGDAGYTDTDRVMTLAESIFSVDTNASVKAYGEDIATGPNSTLGAVMAGLEEAGLANEHIFLVSENDDDTIKDGNSYVNPLRKIMIGQTLSTTSALVKQLREDMNSKNGLVAYGDDDVQNDGLLAGFLGRYFPGSVVLSSLTSRALPGVKENTFSQTDEDLILGKAWGTIDADGNGGVMMPCMAEGEVKILWGTSTNGNDISTEYFKNWLDDEIELVGGRYISQVNSSGAPLRGVKGGTELANVLTNQVLRMAANNNAIEGDDSGNPLGIQYEDQAGQLQITNFTVTINGRVANIVYNLLRETAIVAGDVTLNLRSGEAI